MLNGLKLWNFGAGKLLNEEVPDRCFVLKTCQRTLILGHEANPFKTELPEHHLLEGQDAYLFLLETICGLKSKLIGENEIVGQFKEAYKLYAQNQEKDTKLLLILEKLFKDAKDIRTQYLIGISQKTYASLTRKHLIGKARASHVVILGSGQLAEDLINQFKKKASVSLCARNTLRAQELSQIHGIKLIPWEKRHELMHEAFIANTIGDNSILFNEEFFQNWANLHGHRMFVDLGSPSTIRSSLGINEGVVRLDDIFDEGAIVESQKQQQINLAREAMIDITLKRAALLEQKLKRSDELHSPQISSNVRYL